MVEASELSDRRLIRLEAVIERYRRDFYTVGKALKEIRDGHHYQKLFFTRFERYVNIRWDMSRSHAYRLIEAFLVMENLSPIGGCFAQERGPGTAFDKTGSARSTKSLAWFSKDAKAAFCSEYQKVCVFGGAKTAITFCRDCQRAIQASR
jgi:hypothetical protein